jgi:hypothetical protein
VTDTASVFDDLLGRWTADAETRRSRWPDDPIATTLDLCAAEIREVLAGMSAVPLSPSEYALREGVTEQAVTGWCRRGELEAYRDERGRWRIPGHARRGVLKLREAA